jgi:hypothetical protein
LDGLRHDETIDARDRQQVPLDWIKSGKRREMSRAPGSERWPFHHAVGRGVATLRVSWFVAANVASLQYENASWL